MFADIHLALKIEGAEARLTRDTVVSLKPNLNGPGAFATSIAGGVAAFARPGSPMNKVIGLGLDSTLTLEDLEKVERQFQERGEPTRIELSTLARAENGRLLTERGYHLYGFENVLGLNLADLLPGDTDTSKIERVPASQNTSWVQTIVNGFAQPDETGVVVDSFTKDVISQAVMDMTGAPGYERYLARLEGHVAGGASMRLDGDVALLTGAATLSEFRRRGIQGELLKRRLFDAKIAGAQLAVITTAGGTRSQANAIRQGFSLLYSRAILIRA